MQGKVGVLDGPDFKVQMRFSVWNLHGIAAAAAGGNQRALKDRAVSLQDILQVSIKSIVWLAAMHELEG